MKEQEQSIEAEKMGEAARTESVMWYHNVSLEDAEIYIRTSLQSAIRNVIAVGYYLKCIRDGELYRAEGYDSIWEYASDRFDFSMSTASRYMTRNDRFSVDGNSPILDERYREFSKSQLQEMLSLTDEQMETVTPDMTVKQIREMKKAPKEIPYYEIPGQIEMTLTPAELGMAAGITGPAEDGAFPSAEEIPGKSQKFVLQTTELLPDDEPEAGKSGEITREISVATSQINPDDSGNRDVLQDDADGPETECLSAYGTPKRRYPPDSLIRVEGCEGGQHDCFSCALECQIRGKDRYCREAPMGNPFPCEIVRRGFEDLPDTCQFVDHDLAYHTAGTGEPDPCCKNCQEPCEHVCRRTMNGTDTQTIQEPDEGDHERSDLELLQEMLEAARGILEETIKTNESDPHPVLERMIRKRRLLVGALTGMICAINLPGAQEEITQERMQRLTHKRSNGIKTGYWSPEKKEELVQRLAKYENTGLSPEEVKGMAETCKIYKRLGLTPDQARGLVEFLKEVQRG